MRIDRVDVSAYTIPTDYPESFSPFEWLSTTIVSAEVHAGGKTGIGFSYTDASAADVIRIEPMFFEVVVQPVDGVLRPDRSRPGNGLTFKRADVLRYAA